MESYLYNIWIALTGRSLRGELDRIRFALRESKADYASLYRVYGKLMRAKVEQEEEMNAKLHDCQHLIENLRERLREKEELLLEADRAHRREMADLQACYKEYVKNVNRRFNLADDNFNFDD